MMNKRGAGGITDLVIGGFIAIILLIVLTGGGVGKAFEIVGFLKSIPAPVWVIFGILILFKLMGKKR